MIRTIKLTLIKVIKVKLWNKEKMNSKIEEYCIGKDNYYDNYIIKYDILASIAHAKGLIRAGLLGKEEGRRIIKELRTMLKNPPKVIEEDSHTEIEKYLVKKLGNIGKKIHTGRSRNDQVIAAFRLYLIEELRSIANMKFKYPNSNIIMPGYTHMQKAMPYTVKKWFESYKKSIEEDMRLLKYIVKYINVSPLGSAASYGTSLNIDKKYVAKEAGFDRVYENDLYGQVSRFKYEFLVLSGLKQIMITLNRFSSDMLLFTTSEFGFFSFPDEISMGSSIMPNKKNYDVLEVMRAKSAFVIEQNYPYINLISGYNKDIYLGKGLLIEIINNVKESLEVFGILLEKIIINKEKLKRAITKEIYMTEKAYELVKKGVPFRDAYFKVKEG